MRTAALSPVKFFIYFWLWPVLIALMIFFGSSLSNPPVPVAFTGTDKLIHVLAFIPLGFLVLRAMNAHCPKKKWISIVFSFILCTFYGVSDEVHQLFVPGRNPDAVDVLADAIGTILGIATYIIIVRALRNGKKND